MIDKGFVFQKDLQIKRSIIDLSITESKSMQKSDKKLYRLLKLPGNC